MNPEIDISQVVLRTERLMLRPWRQTDLQDLFAFASQSGVGEMCGWRPHTAIEESQRMLDALIAGKISFALEYQDKAIGMLGIPKYDEAHFPQFDDLRCRELSFILNRDYWGRGIMPEAVREMLRHAFEDCGMKKVWCGYYEGNDKSQRVQEKCGFRYQWTTHGLEVPLLHETRTGHVNMMTKEDWLGMQ